ncbi:glycosyltransferase involved in cell wall biosynthesis [Pontibacter mucosus]|uniref:Glycosyltransferase involved in cell wall biosynthesis n=2 Tax=Pontibacter mucosus TaxID=1649266 RepID=A0A2T5YQ99_9BACT|nr:glycosyltransferase involved in cell wall biosynthesis [Pontibacter mucosus]
MNILRVIASMDPYQGGPCQGIRNAIPELRKLGARNEVVCLDSPQATYLVKDEFLIHALGPRKGPWQYSAKLVPWLLANLGRFDAVVVHGLWLYHGYAVRKAVYLLKKRQKTRGESQNKIPRLYVMPHGMLDPYFQRAKERKLKAVRNWFYWKLVESHVVNEADGLLFTCEQELQLAREPFQPYSPRQVVNVGYGIADPPAFEQEMQQAFALQCPQLQGQPYLLFLSRIHEKKGVDLLLRAYAFIRTSKLKPKAEPVLISSTVDELVETMPVENNFPKLVIAGPGLETPYGHSIQELVNESPELHSSVFFPGMLTGEAKWGAFYGCEAFILPSHQENFGIAVVEALACGKPVLISDQVNIWKEIRNGKGGLVAKDTLDGAQQLLQEWQSLPDSSRESMGLKARETFEKCFAIRPAAHRFLSALKV